MRTEPVEISRLRRQAKEIVRLTGEKHTKVLHELAMTKGYKNWETLLREWKN